MTCGPTLSLGTWRLVATTVTLTLATTALQAADPPWSALGRMPAAQPTGVYVRPVGLPSGYGISAIDGSAAPMAAPAGLTSSYGASSLGPDRSSIRTGGAVSEFRATPNVFSAIGVGGSAVAAPRAPTAATSRSATALAP